MAVQLAPGRHRESFFLHLRERSCELEEATLARVYGVADPTEVKDPEYMTGLRAAVAAALQYGIAGLAAAPERPAPIPPQILLQARHAARSGVSLDVVVRRYFAGYTLLGDFVIRVAKKDRFAIGGAELQRIWRAETILFDRVLAAVAEEYRREVEEKNRNVEQRRFRLVQRLLAGELLDGQELNYDFEGWHLGVVASGAGASGAIRHLAAALDRRLLLVKPCDDSVWGWLGSVQQTQPPTVLGLAASAWPEGCRLAVGLPAQGPEGWRLSHSQAKAALPVAERGPGRVVAYGEVALLASALQDRVLVDSLKHLYLTPLEQARDGGRTARQTLRAYFAAQGNISSAAAALGVNRQTIANRLHKIEEWIGRPLSACGPEVEAALRVHAIVGAVPTSEHEN